MPRTIPIAHVGEGALGRTRRSDRWWISPISVALGLGIFVVYSTWAALAGDNYSSGPYLSPFYSPLIRIPGTTISPALLVLWAPLGFRLSCYYYRKAYYRAFFLSPPACAVSEAVRPYRGEAGILRWLPMLHRWFLYASILVLAVLWWDAALAFDFDGRFGIGLGSIVLLLNAAFLTFFTFGCHALRSLVGGNQRCFDCSALGAARYRGWRIVSALTGKHPLWAWISLYSVGIADLYVRLLAMGLIGDPRLLF
ncbi:MAG: succinate dehydrogenase [Candidatus Baltobacteraceae bacterium]